MLNTVAIGAAWSRPRGVDRTGWRNQWLAPEPCADQMGGQHADDDGQANVPSFGVKEDPPVAQAIRWESHQTSWSQPQGLTVTVWLVVVEPIMFVAVSVIVYVPASG